MTQPPGSAPGTSAWRAAQADALLRFGTRSALPTGGFGWLDDSGGVDADHPRELWVTARMTHIYSLAAMAPAAADGAGEYAEIARRGVAALSEVFADGEHGGWYRSVDAAGVPVDDRKANYEHSFILLAASSASAAGIQGAQALFDAAAQVIERYFWQAAELACAESYPADWAEPEAYRGANSNMHATEAYLAAADVSGDPTWRRRALAMADRLINRGARENQWRLPEHFTADWQVDREYNSDARADPFRPYGTTPGHSFEWARLLLDLSAALEDPPDWLVEAARGLFGTAVRLGWAADGHDGFVYTLDWADQVVVHERMHWVIAEAVLAADALHRATGDAGPAKLATRWWAEIDAYFVDPQGGSWHHELDAEHQVSRTVWSGKPDIYHAYQAVVLPDLPLAPAAAAALRSS